MIALPPPQPPASLWSIAHENRYVTLPLIFLDTILLKYFVETGSKIKKKISTKIPKHELTRFRDAVSQTPQSGYFSRCILWAVTYKTSTMYVIADKISHKHRNFWPILSDDFLSVSVILISFHNLFQNSHFLRTLKKFKNKNERTGRVIQIQFHSFWWKQYCAQKYCFREI